MTAQLSRRTTKEEALDLDLKNLQHETTIYDPTQTGEILSVIDDKKLLFKIDCRLMPILCITYALQSIDKTTLSYAAVFGLADETNISGPEFSWLGAIFYLGYMFWEWPTSYLLQRFPLGKFLGTSVILWGIALACHAAGHNFAGLATARFFLGVFEACIQPVTMVMFSIWYTRMEQPLRLGIWIGCAGLGYVVAGITSFGIGHIHGDLSSWRYTFLIWGCITIAWGVVVLIFLPDNPVTAKFLSEDEKMGVIQRVKGNGTGLEGKTFKMSQMWETLTDTKTWLLFIFAGLIIRGLGFSKLRTTLIQMPSGAIQFVVCTGATFFASRYENARLLTMFLCLLPTLAGVIGMWTLPRSVPWGRMVCLWITFTYTATWTLSMSVVTANTAGSTKKSTTAAMLLIGYCLGNFIGPFFFKKPQAPRYELGVGMMLTCIGIQMLSIGSLYLLFLTRNRKRAAANALSAEHVAEGQMRGLSDETDLQNHNFEYVY